MKKSLLIVTILIVLTAALSYGLARTKYVGTDVLARLEIPYRLDNWTGQDVKIELNPNDQRYFFISGIFSRVFTNKYNEGLLFIVLDANNFHNPKVCFRGAGYEVKEVPDVALTLPDKRVIKATSLYAKKADDALLVSYWICINGKVVDWNRQKLYQLWFSLFGKKKTGYMIRFEIATPFERLDNARKIADDFARNLFSKLSAEQAAYIFGK